MPPFSTFWLVVGNDDFVARMRVTSFIDGGTLVTYYTWYTCRDGVIGLPALHTIGHLACGRCGIQELDQAKQCPYDACLASFCDMHLCHGSVVRFF